MADKDHIRDYTTVAGDNTDVDGVSIAEGTAPSNINDAIREVMSHQAELHADTRGALVSGGSGGAYTLTTNETLTAYAQSGGLFVWEANHAMPDTATATLNIDSVGAKPLRKHVSLALNENDIKANQMVISAYEANNDVIHVLSVLGNSDLVVAEPTSADDAVPLKSIAGHINGLVISQDTDSDHDISISAGVAVDNAATMLMRISSALVKRIDANWASGTGNGGFPSALTIAINTWYHIGLVDDGSGNVDAGFDTDIAFSNLLSDTGGSLYRRIGSVLTDGSSNIIDFVSEECEGGGLNIRWANPPEDVNSASVTTGGADVTMSTPLGIKVDGLFNVQGHNNASGDTNISYYVYSPDVNDEQASTSGAPGATVTGTSNDGTNHMASVQANVVTDTSSQVSISTDTTSNERLRITTLGWKDFRR